MNGSASSKLLRRVGGEERAFSPCTHPPKAKHELPKLDADVGRSCAGGRESSHSLTIPVPAARLKAASFYRSRLSARRERLPCRKRRPQTEGAMRLGNPVSPCMRLANSKSAAMEIESSAMSDRNLILRTAASTTGRLVFALIGICMFCVSPKSAEIRPDKFWDGLAAVIDGDIVEGDYERVRSFIFGSNGTEPQFVKKIFLASSGGNVAEAVRIGRLFRELKLETVIPTKYTSQQSRDLVISKHGLSNQRNYVCASACFFIFVAGVRRDKDALGLFEPLLGIHRPFLSEKDLRSLSGDNAMTVAAQTKAIIENYLNEMGAPRKYFDMMYAIPKGDIRWISEDELESDFRGFIPELRDWIDARCDKLTKGEKALWEILGRQHDAAESRSCYGYNKETWGTAFM